MRKEVLVCDFCQRDSVDAIAEKCCCICGKMYCKNHIRTINVCIQSYNPPLGCGDSFEVCPDCHSLFTWDNWTSGDQTTRAGKYDRPIIKEILPNTIETAKQSLKDIRQHIGPNDVWEWIDRREKARNA